MSTAFSFSACKLSTSYGNNNLSFSLYPLLHLLPPAPYFSSHSLIHLTEGESGSSSVLPQSSSCERKIERESRDCTKMEISNSHELQAMSSHGLEELLIACPKPSPPPPPEKKPRPQPEQALKCPRCDSTNTKFCYYNNYSLTQPRYFCKSCRRYWTKGGSLRNVPVGGGCRKNKRSSSSSSPSSSSSSNCIIPSSKRPQDDQTSFVSYNHGDLTLAFARQLWPSLADHEQFFLGNPNPNPNTNPNVGTTGGFLNFMRNGFLEPSNINAYHQIYYGINGSVMEEVELGSNQSSTERSCKMLMDLQMPNGVDGGLAMEYSSCHGLINSSLI